MELANGNPHHEVSRILAGMPAEELKEVLEKQGNSTVSAIGFLLNKVAGFFGFIASLFQDWGVLLQNWAAYTPPPQGTNARFADRATNNGVYDILLKKGKRLYESAQVDQLHRQKFYQEIRNLRQAEQLGNAAVDFCRCLPVDTLQNPLFVDPNDVKVILLTVLNGVVAMKHANRTYRTEMEQIVLSEGRYYYAHYKFVADVSLESTCFVSSKVVDVEVVMFVAPVSLQTVTDTWKVLPTSQLAIF